MEIFRVFVAITPDDSILDAVEERVRALKREITEREVRWEQRSKWHVTLRFLGNVPSDSIPNLTAALQTCCEGKQCFRTQVRELGGFPSLKWPRVLWAGIEDVAGKLTELHACVSDASARFSSERNEKRFHPHLTIARVKGESRRLSSHIAAVMQAMRGAEFGEWTVQEVELWRSKLSPGGSQYELLAQIPLVT